MRLRSAFYLAGAFVHAVATLGSYAFGEGDGVWYWASIWVLAVAVVAWPIELVRLSVRGRTITRKLDVQATLTTALLSISQSTGIDPQKLGVHAYWVTWRLRWKKPFAQRVQKRIGRVRHQANLPESTITWTKGKGVVGQCWQKPGKIHPVFLAQTHSEFLVCSREAWVAAPEAKRMNLSYDEWEVAQRYAGIVAAPIVDDGERRYMGCISVDCVEASDYTKLRTKAPSVDNILLDTAKLIRIAYLGR